MHTIHRNLLAVQMSCVTCVIIVYSRIEFVMWILSVVISLSSIATLLLSIITVMLSHVHHHTARPLGPPYTHIHMHTYVHSYTHTYTHTHVHTRTHGHMNTHMHTHVHSKTGRTNLLLVRLAYSYSIVLIVFVLKALINLYVRSEYYTAFTLSAFTL